MCLALCVFMHVAYNAKIFHVIRNEEDYVTLQNELYKWSQLWQLKCNISKCKHLHFGQAHHHGFYYLNGIPVTSHCDFRILFDASLSSVIIPLKLQPKLNEYTWHDQEIL